MCEPSSPAVGLGAEQFASQQVQQFLFFITVRVLIIHPPSQSGLVFIKAVREC